MLFGPGNWRRFALKCSFASFTFTVAPTDNLLHRERKREGDRESEREGEQTVKMAPKWHKQARPVEQLWRRQRLLLELLHFHSAATATLGHGAYGLCNGPDWRRKKPRETCSACNIKACKCIPDSIVASLCSVENAIKLHVATLNVDVDLLAILSAHSPPPPPPALGWAQSIRFIAGQAML